MRLITRFLIILFALLLVSQVVPGVTINGLWAAVIAALVLGLLNAIVRPILLLLTLPVTLLTLGLFIFILNAFIFWFASTLISGFTVSGFLPALLGSLVVSLVSIIANRFLH